MDKVLENIYFDTRHPAGFSSAERLYRAAHIIRPDITRKYVKTFLTKYDAYTLNKPARHKFQRSRLISPGLYIQNDLDFKFGRSK